MPEGFEGYIFPTELQRYNYLDRQLNEVYAVIRFLLPANRFAKVKEAQRGWLKQRDALSNLRQECRATEIRIRALRDSLWQ
jgi:uncharacterized protein YecT (DUF1311 family)